MKKEFYLTKLADISEVLFVLAGIYFYAIYQYCYVYSASVQWLHVATVVFVSTGILFVIFNFVISIITIDDSSYKRTHKFMCALKSKQDPYAKYTRSFSIRSMYVWRHFVFGINIWCIGTLIVLLGLTAFCTYAIYATFLNTLSDQFTILTVSLVCILVFCFCIYKLFPKIFRSSTGLVRYLISSSLPLNKVDTDFKNSDIISCNLRISFSTIYFRTKDQVNIIDLQKLQEYKMLKSALIIYTYDSVIPFVLHPKTKKEYDAIAAKLLRF